MTDASAVGAVRVEAHGPVALVTLDRPRKRNALSSGMERMLSEALAGETVRRSRAVVLTGAGDCFSAGADVTEVAAMTPRAIAAYYRDTGGVYEEVAALPQPVVAAITGYCLGGGLELALAADVRVADPAADFGFPETGIGILPSSGGIARMLRTAGEGRTRDLVLRGRRFTAADAERWGLVSEVAEPGDHLRRAIAIAQELAGLDPLTADLTKQVLGAAAVAPGGALLLERLAYAALAADGGA